MSEPRILLADDHELVRAGFRSLLEKLNFRVVGEASDGNQALTLIRELQPDIVLMDISMPGLNGLEVTRRLKQELPAVKVIILSMYSTAEYARRAVLAGAVGYVLKNARAAELERAMHAVARGEIFLSPAISKHIVEGYAQNMPSGADALSGLTSRQREVLQLIAEGHARKDIAAKLHISPRTFDTLRAQLMATLDIHDVAGLVRFAARAGLIPPEE